MAELEYQRKTEERKRLLTVAPAIVNQVFGREVFPQAAVDSSMIETLVSRLDADGLQTILSVMSKYLKPEELAMLVGRMSDIQERADAQKMVKGNGAPQGGVS